ncbi:MAG: hypothetical protein ACWGMZ_09295, partial [Thermoguttaceae bacterium]
SDDSSGAPSSDDGLLTETHLGARATFPVGTTLHVGGALSLWLPGGDDVGGAFKATSGDASFIAAYQPDHSPLTIGLALGLHLNRSRYAGGDLQRYSAADKLALGASDSIWALRSGLALTYRAGAIDWIASRFKKSRPATLYFDEIRTPTYTDCMNLLYRRMLSNRLSGIFHAGGPRRLSLYQIAQIINRVGGYDPKHLMGIPRREAGPIPPRAGNVAMNSDKLIHSLGFNPFDPWPYCDSLVPTDPLWHLRRPSHEEHSPQHLHQVLCRNPLIAS